MPLAAQQREMAASHFREAVKVGRHLRRELYRRQGKLKVCCAYGGAADKNCASWYQTKQV